MSMNRNIKRNKVQRAWHKYKRLVYLMIAVLVVIIIIIVAIVKAVGGKSDKNKKQPETTAPIETTAPVETTAPEPEQTEPVPEETSSEEIPVGPSGDIVKNLAEEEFANESFFDDAVFVGDTFVAGIDLYGYIDKKRLVYNENWTIGKAVSNGLSNVASSNANKVFIEIGINDLNNENNNGEKVFENYKELINGIREKLPNASIYVISTFPVTSGFEARDNIAIDNDDVAKLNQLLAEYEGITFLNVNKSISNDSGELNPDISSNGLNIKKAYYGFILNLIAEMCQ